MKTPSSRALGSTAALLACGLAVFGISAWALGEWRLTSLGADHIPVAPVSAFLLLLLGVGLLLKVLWPEQKAADFSAMAAAILATLVSTVELARAAWGFSLPWDLWRASVETGSGSMEIGLMSPLTAMSFLLTAIALGAQGRWGSRHRLTGWLSDLTAASGGLICGLVLIAYLAGTPLGYNQSSVPMAELTALAFLLLDVGLVFSERNLVVRRQDREGAGDLPAKPLPANWRATLGLAAFATLCVFAAFFYSRNEQTELRRIAQDQLAAIAELKGLEIASWRQERIADARVLATSPDLAEFLVSTLADSARGTAVQAHLSVLRQAYGYRKIVLYDRTLAAMLTSPADRRGEKGLSAATQRSLMVTGAVIVEDLHRDEADGPVHLDLIAPVWRADRPDLAGAVKLTIDAEQQLYPLLRKWPTPSDSAETILVR